MNTPAPRPIIATAPAQVSWQGQVDDSATIYFQAGKSWTDNVTKKGVEDVTATFDTPLPAAAVTVTLTGVSGRGQVNVVQQPTRDNNYTAGVRIVDHDPGSSGYKFVLSW